MADRLPVTTLAELIGPCGPVVDARAAERVREALGDAPGIDGAWQALAPVFAASPYLGRLAARRPQMLAGLLAGEPSAELEALVRGAEAASALGPQAGGAQLRRLKAALHLLTALCDLGGVWGLDQVTGALTRFADAAIRAALVLAARSLQDRLLPFDPGPAGPMPGLFVIAMGKLGAFELNYSSDIDISVFYEPGALPLAPEVEPQAFAQRFTHALAAVLHDRTDEGYVFRVDLRLRPDPASTPPAVPVDEALEYYEGVGQN